MPNFANNPAKKTWIHVPENSDFPIQNLPFGVFITKDDVVTIGTRIGNTAIDMGALQSLNYFEGIDLTDDMFMQDSLNDFISDGKKTWRAVRNRLSEIFEDINPKLRDNNKHKSIILFDISEIEMLLPIQIGDYTDFYSSKEHATNVGKMFRDPENALLPNWLHLPVGYHGRSSTIIPSGIPVHRPQGQILPNGETLPVFGPSKLVDFELETAFITTDANIIGEPIDINEANNYIFGMVLFNDWSARDIQKWEYVPLGPFLAKNFASSISCWIVTMDALLPFKTIAPDQNPKPLNYLIENERYTYDINLQVSITPENGHENIISKSNFKYLYWTMNQQLTHHASNGCEINSGDMMGSGTISGPTQDSFGSMLELTWGGKNPIKLSDGTERKFINDNDTVTVKGYCKNDDVRIGFGEVSSKLLPVFTKEKKRKKV